MNNRISTRLAQDVADLRMSTVDTIVSTSASSYEVTATFGYLFVFCDCESNSITINLPTAVDNLAKITIKKTDGTANTVTIDANESEYIDGDLTRVLSNNYESITIISDGGFWRIIATVNYTVTDIS